MAYESLLTVILCSSTGTSCGFIPLAPDNEDSGLNGRVQAVQDLAVFRLFSSVSGCFRLFSLIRSPDVFQDVSGR